MQDEAGNAISLKQYTGKKILIAIVGNDLWKDKSPLLQFDSLQKANPSIVVIVLPASDFGNASDSTIVSQDLQSSKSGLIKSSPAKVKKSNGKDRPQIIQWLSDVQMNSHFDMDVLTDYQLYFINETGALYAVLGKGASSATINELLQQKNF